MARTPQITPQVLAPLIHARGPVSATELAALLSVNRTTIVRGLAKFGDELVTLGATRNRRYALRRHVLTVGNTWPIYRIDETGQSHRWATLEALQDRLWRVVWAESAPAWANQFSDATGVWEGFPFFLADIRPQGFLGRAIAKRMSCQLSVPEDPRKWSDDHTALFLHTASEDLPGSLVIGDDCLRRAQMRNFSPQANQTVTEAERYSLMAEEAMVSLPGSSAGGEQPKFLTSVISATTNQSQSVLVKFSPPLDQPTGRRWADLMACECLALEVLSEHGLAMSGARTLDAGGRRFLEIPRFDRIESSGRRGVVTLAALHPEADGTSARTAWMMAAEQLRQDELIDAETSATMMKLHAFGELIGNTDMHAGNLAFWLEETLPFQLAPAYDVLPMLWAPGPQGEIIDRSFSPPLPLPSLRSHWQEAATWASEFWDRVIDDSRLSEEFVGYAHEARNSLKQLRNH